MVRGSYTISTIDGVYGALGGVPGVTRMTKRSPQALSNWQAQGRIAANFFFLMNSELERQGVSADPALWGQRMPEEQAA